MVVDRRKQPIGVGLIDFGLAFPFGEQPFFQGTGLQECCQAFTSSRRLNIRMLSLGRFFEGEDEYDELKTQDYAWPRYQ